MIKVFNNDIKNVLCKNIGCKRVYSLGSIVWEQEKWWEQYGIEAQYVISNGVDNWIDTWIPIQNDLVIEMGITYLESGREQSGFGAYDLNNVVIEAGSVTSGGNAFYAYDDDRTWDVRAFEVELNKHYNLKYNFQDGLQIVYIDDVEVHRTNNTSGALVGLTMVLFARNYGTSSSNTRQNYMNAKWTHFKVSKPDGTVLADYFPLYVTNSGLTDVNGNEIAMGSYVLVDNVTEKSTILYGTPLVGEIDTFYKRVDNITFESGNIYPTMEIGKWSDYDTIITTFSSNDTSNSDVFFGRSTETGFIGYPDADDMILNSNLATPENYTITPKILPSIKGNGEKHLLTINYNTTNNNPLTFGAYYNGLYSKQKYLYDLKLYKEDVLVHNLVPAVLLVYYQGYNAGTVGFIDETTRQFFGPSDSNYNFIATPYWWKEYGALAEYIENVNNESYIVTDVTPVPNELSLNIECVFLDDITSAPFGCRPTGNASISSNNIFQVNNTIRIDLLGDASLSIPKENNIVYNIDYNGVNNVFTINGSKYNGSVEKSSIETPYPFAIFANNSEGVLSVGSACIMRYGKFNINNKQYIPIQVIKQFTDINGVTHNVGDWIMVNRLSYKDVPTHVGNFTGEIKLDNDIYFKSVSEQNPYYDLGRRIAYGKRIEIPISFEDATIDPYPLYGLFGSRQGYSQSTAYNTFIGRNDLPMATDVAISMIPIDRKFTITLEDGKGYIDGVLTTTDTTSVTEWNYNSFLYNVNTEGLGGPMSTYRLPIGARVYGCQIYDVATGIIENNYQPQLDQTLKCSITGEVLPKLGINETDSWEVNPTI